MIGQLIKITSVPIELEMKVEKPRVQRRSPSSDIEISRSVGGLNIKSKPLKVEIDSSEARNELNPTAMRSIDQAASSGRQAAQDATARYAENGSMYLEGAPGEDVTGKIIDRDNRHSTPHVNIKAWPSQGAVKTFVDKGELSTAYDMDKLSFDVRKDQGDFEFIPGNVEIKVKQYPSVKIEYTGKPMYVPPRDDE